MANSAGTGPNSPDARHVLFGLYYDRTVRAVATVLQDRQLAEDATQEAFIRAFQRLSELREPEKFGPWVFTIAVNTGRRLLRERQRLQPVADMSHYTPAVQDWENQVEAEVERRLLRQETRGQLGRLSDEHREALLLFYWYQLSVEEIADLTGIPVGTVKSRLHRSTDTSSGPMRRRTSPGVPSADIPPVTTRSPTQEPWPESQSIPALVI